MDARQVSCGTRRHNGHERGPPPGACRKGAGPASWARLVLVAVAVAALAALVQAHTVELHRRVSRLARSSRPDTGGGAQQVGTAGRIGAQGHNWGAHNTQLLARHPCGAIATLGGRPPGSHRARGQI